jgi:hypothetical protein
MLTERANEEKELAQKVADDGRLKSGLDTFIKQHVDVNKVDGDNHPIMSRAYTMAIVKVLIPKVAPLTKLSNFTTLKSCTKWLGASGSTWVDKMMAIVAANEED